MRTPILAAAVVTILSLPSAASAQVSVAVHLDLPAVLPALVVVQPGVQVVPQVHEEVFFVDGWYWARRDARWYRARDHRGGWVVVEDRAVPATIAKVPPGKYKNYKGDKHDGKHDNGKHKGQGKKDD
jgi:hypothetical protein